MEFGPIFRSLLRSRARVILIVAEVALTLAIVAQGNPAPLMPQLEKALLGVEKGRFLRLRTTVDTHPAGEKRGWGVRVYAPPAGGQKLLVQARGLPDASQMQLTQHWEPSG